MGENELLELHKIPVLSEDVAVDLWICDSQILLPLHVGSVAFYLMISQICYIFHTGKIIPH